MATAPSPNTDLSHSLVLESLSAAADLGNLDERGIPKKLAKQYRAVKIAGYDKEGRTVTMAVSSSTPVERYWGAEILSHEKGALNTDRLDRGVALLFNHDYNQHLGRSQSYKLGDPLHVTCGFAGNPLAREKEGDVDSGHLVDVSIGYTIDEVEVVEDKKTGFRTYTVTKWTLLEVSLVTVPADPTVGVGRDAKDGMPVNVRSFRSVDPDDPDEDEEDGDSEDEGERSQQAAAETEPISEANPISAPISTPTLEAQRTNDMSMAAAANPNPPAAQVVADPAAQNAERVAGLRSLHTQYPNEFNARSLEAAIALDFPLADAKRSVADALIAAAQRSDIPTITDGVLDDKGKRGYSMLRALRHVINQAKPGTFSAKDADAGFEREIDSDLRKRISDIGAPAGFGAGLLTPGHLPVDVSSAERGAQMLGRRSLTAGSSTGANTINTSTESNYIQLLRSRNRLSALGAGTISGVHGLFRIPRQTATAQSTWLAELGAATNSDVTLDFITASPKRNSIMGSYTMEMLAQTAIDVENLVRMDQILSKATTREVVGFSGTGGTMPTGLFNLSGIAVVLTGSTRAANGTVTAGAGGVPLTFVDCNNFEAAISTVNADTGTLGWAFTPRVRAAMRSTPKFPNGLSDPIWPTTSTMNPEGLQEGPLGYTAGVTTNVPTGFTVNSVANLHGGAFGIWSSMNYVEWGVSELIYDPYTGATQGVYKVLEHELLDILFRHPEQFAVSTSILPS